MTNEPRRILIIENDIDALSVIYTTLLPLDYSVEAAIDSADLRPRIERFQPDLLMLGQNLGEAGSQELCQWLKQHFNARVILIGRPQKLSPGWAEQLCFDELLPKPVEPSVLLSKLNSLLPA